MVLTADGDVYTWGHRIVTPRRVGLVGARDISRASPAAPPLAFHKGQTDVSRPRAVRIATGAAHTSCITQVRCQPCEWFAYVCIYHQVGLHQSPVPVTELDWISDAAR